MNAAAFVDAIGSDFFTGVPDSQLKALCDHLMDRYGIDGKHHVIAANEGNCCGLAAGYHLASGKVPVIYMQNSGMGNAVNPIASLLHDKVYGIPAIFVIGWRGEPGVQDEPQHIFQGQITLGLLEDLGIRYFIVSADTIEEDIFSVMGDFRNVLDAGGQVAFVVQKDALFLDRKMNYRNNYMISREDAIRCIARTLKGAIIVCTTGKAGRELFEIREETGSGHEEDFLTVGSMGHASSIALGIALQKPEKKVFCIDGDGALLMHAGAMATIGALAPENFGHIVINNEAHESVGGLPTAMRNVELPVVAKAFGYRSALAVESLETLEKELCNMKSGKGPAMIEVKTSIGARKDLGRPTSGTKESKKMFMERLRG